MAMIHEFRDTFYISNHFILQTIGLRLGLDVYVHCNVIKEVILLLSQFILIKLCVSNVFVPLKMHCFFEKKIRVILLVINSNSFECSVL